VKTNTFLMIAATILIVVVYSWLEQNLFPPGFETLSIVKGGGKVGELKGLTLWGGLWIAIVASVKVLLRD